MARTILHSAFNPPIYSDKIYERERALKKLMDARGKRMILVRAGAGYGKTNLLTHFFKRLEMEKLWLSIPQGSFGTVKFITHLFYGIFEKLESSTKEKWESILHNILIGSMELDQMVMNLINLIEDLPGDTLYLILDDLQYLQIVDREKELGALQMLSRFVSHKVHFIVASREELPFPVNRLRLEGQLMELGEQDLVFAGEELRQFLQECGYEADEQYIRWLEAKTEGWVAGICLFLSFNKLKLSESSNIEAVQPVRNYLAEMLAELPPKIYDFVQKTSIFETILVDICNEYLGIHDSQRILDELVEVRMLTQRYVEDGLYYYRYHTLLKEFFLAQLDVETKKLYHLKLAAVYRIREQREFVINHLLAAGEEWEAVHLIKKEAPILVRGSDVNLLSEWLDYFERKDSVADPVLDMYRGWIAQNKGQLDEALTYYLKAEPGLLAVGDMPNWFHTRMQLALIYWWNDECETAYKISEDTLQYVPAEELSYRAGLYKVMGASAIVLNKRYDGADYLHIALNLARQADDKIEIAWILNHIAFGHYTAYGDLQKAIESYEEAAGYFKLGKNKAGLGLVLTDLAYTYLIMNDLDKAESLLVDAEYLYLEMNNVLSLRHIWNFQVRLALKRGNYRKAEEILKKVEVTWVPQSKIQDFQYAQFTFVSYIYHLYRGDGNAAEKWLECTRKYLESGGDKSYFTQEYQLSWVVLYLKTQRHVEAQRLASDLADYAKEAGYRLMEVEAKLLYAIARRNKDSAKTIELDKELAKIAESEYAFLQEKYADLILQMTDSILEVAVQAGESGGFEQPIRVSFFGDFTVHNRGQKITSRDWTNRKAVDLLKYLLLHHDRWVRQEDLLDLFWPESDVEKGKQSLYVALYNIRRKWEPDLEKGKNSQFIQGKRGMYRIQIPEPYWLDIESFRDFVAEGLRLFKERRFLKAEEFLKEGKRLYIGDFLQDNLYDEWTRNEREELLQSYLKLLFTLAQIYGESQNYSSAIQLLQESLRKNPLQDAVHHLLMQYYLKIGQFNEAIQHYREFNRIYLEELGVEMPEEIRILYHKMVG